MEGSTVAADETASLAAIVDNDGLRIVKLADGSTVSLLVGHGDTNFFPIASADNRQIMLYHEYAGLQRFSVWPIDGVSPTFHSVRLPDGFSALHAVPDVNVVLGDDDKGIFVVHSILTGEQIAKFSVPNLEGRSFARLSPDGKHAMLNADLIETRTGNVLYHFNKRKAVGGNALDDDFVRSFAFSADGQRLALGWQQGTAEIWSVEPPRLIKQLDSADDMTTSLTFSPDNRLLIGGSRDDGHLRLELRDGQAPPNP